MRFQIQQQVDILIIISGFGIIIFALWVIIC